jgi:MoxR-like ATPase
MTYNQNNSNSSKTPSSGQTSNYNYVTQAEIEIVKQTVQSISYSFSQKVVGQTELLYALLVALFAKGNILLEGVPGLAKTRSVKTLSESINGSFKRIQFTPDLLPSDVIGNQIYDPKTTNFVTKKGPIFANIVLADEINRAPAKVQSALLEAMQERQVTLGGSTYTLPEPFLVLATQNPIEQEGTYNLPEAQVDRFLFKVIVNYPSAQEESSILDMLEISSGKKTLSGNVPLEQIQKIQALLPKVYIDQSLKNYIVQIVQATRYPAQFGMAELTDKITYGASPRGSLCFMLGAKAFALINGRDHVIPEDIKGIRHEVLRHRILLSYEAQADGLIPESVIEQIFQTVPVP